MSPISIALTGPPCVPRVAGTDENEVMAVGFIRPAATVYAVVRPGADDERQWAKLDAAQRAAFRRAVAVLIADLKAGEGFSPELRVHKLVNTEIWSLTWATDGRALFRFGAEITPGQTHIIWEAIGTHAETYGRVK